jgi:hypothetical protein
MDKRDCHRVGIVIGPPLGRPIFLAMARLTNVNPEADGSLRFGRHARLSLKKAIRTS